jgi:hypothetical protein
VKFILALLGLFILSLLFANLVLWLLPKVLAGVVVASAALVAFLFIPRFVR